MGQSTLILQGGLLTCTCTLLHVYACVYACTCKYIVYTHMEVLVH